MERRPLLWVGTSREDVRAFPDAARRRAGHELDLVQQGVEPTDFKPMPAIGAGAIELRVRAEGAFRVVYVAKFPEGVYVLHAFRKRTRQTAQADIALAARRYRHVLEERRKA